MQKNITTMVALLFAGGAFGAFVSPAPAQTDQDQKVLVLRGAQILPITGPPIAQGVLVIKAG
jgi:hypothetical protein